MKPNKDSFPTESVASKNFQQESFKTAKRQEKVRKSSNVKFVKVWKTLAALDPGTWRQGRR